MESWGGGGGHDSGRDMLDVQLRLPPWLDWPLGLLLNAGSSASRFLAHADLLLLPE